MKQKKGTITVKCYMLALSQFKLLFRLTYIYSEKILKSEKIKAFHVMAMAKENK